MISLFAAAIFIHFSANPNSVFAPDEDVRIELKAVEGLGLPPRVAIERHGDLDVVHVKLTVLYDRSDK